MNATMKECRKKMERNWYYQMGGCRAGNADRGHKNNGSVAAAVRVGRNGVLDEDHVVVASGWGGVSKTK